MLNSIVRLTRRYETTGVKTLLLLFGFLLALHIGLSLHPLHGQSPIVHVVASFQLVDNFEGLAVGSLDGQNGWHATSGVTVASVPANGANLVLAATVNNVQAYKALPSAIDNANSGTLHFRLRRNGHIDGFGGASDLAAPNDWSSYEPQFGAQSVHAADEFVVRDASQFDVLGNSFSDQTWYCVWLVTNNASDTYQVYAKGGSFAQPTQLKAAGQTAFGFRNGGSDPLLTFLTRVDPKSQGSLYLDDIYVDPTSQNLAIPGNDCGASSTDITPSVVNWISPVGNTQVHEAACGTTAPLEVTATDASGVNRVEFSRWDAVNNVKVPIEMDGTPPYQASIDVCSLNMEWNEIDVDVMDNAGNWANAYIWIYRIQPPPSANFDAWPQSGEAPLTSSMHIVSTDNISSCTWDYGDGTTGTACAAYHDHIYTAVGIYTVKLTVFGPGGSDTQTRDNYIMVTNLPPPTANFSANLIAGVKPLTVNFIDQSTGNITNWSWNFGDGGTSTQQNPSHTYINAGDYTVLLTVSGPGGSNAKTQTNYIHVTEPTQPPVANFTANPISGVKPLAVNFTDQSTGNITSWSWSFGDGGTSTQQSPAHAYASAGDYTVSLTISGPGGSNTKTQTNYIHVSEPIPPPVANFSASPLFGNKPLTVNFADQSTGNITGWSWNFGDGGTSTQQSPAHTYNNAGDYTVVLTVNGPGGSNTKTTSNYIHVSEPLGLAVPTLNAIVNTEQDGAYVIAWQTVANVASYELQEQANNGNWTTIYTGSATSYNLTGKVASVWCYRLRSNSAGSNSDWSIPQCTTVATNAPSLTLPDKVLALPGSQVILPVTYVANGNNISAILFSINYDQTKLNFNPADGNGDGLPDAIQFSGAIPAGFVKLVAFDASDTNGELDLTISDFAAAPRPVPGGIIASITLGVLAASPVKVEAPVNFAATSFGGASGDVPGVSDDGSVFITDRLSLYLPLIRK